MSRGWWNHGDAAPIAAVAIMLTDGANTHVGIAYRLDDDTERLGLIHLAFHCKLEVEDVSQSDQTDSLWRSSSGAYHFLVPPLPSAVLESLATRCRSIARNRPEVKFGFALAKDVYFDQDGHLFSKDDRGLNCSTFVLAVFRSLSILLVDEVTWPARPEDEQRFRDLLHDLRIYINKRFSGDPNLFQLHQEYATRIAPDVKSIRIRPEETAGASLANDVPVPFSECEPLGRKILERLGITTA